MFANVSKDRDSVDAIAKIVNEEAVSVRAISHSFSAWLALPSVNINREPYSNPHAIRAITKKNISLAYFIGLNTTTLNKLDGIPYTTVRVDINRGAESTGPEDALLYWSHLCSSRFFISVVRPHILMWL